MIRFVDLHESYWTDPTCGPMPIFAFLSTITNKFYEDEVGRMTFSSLEDVDDLNADKDTIKRCKRLIPDGYLKGSYEWTQTPPVFAGSYWWWNGCPDDAPVPMFVGWSGTTNRTFVQTGQLGFTQAKDCIDFGGWWKPLPIPETPDIP